VIDQNGFGRLTSIYNEVRLIALSQEILHDPVVYSSLNESLDEGFVNAIKKSLINMAEAEIKNPLLEEMDINGFAESSNIEYDSFLPAYDYLNSIFN
jgi:ABC-type phosphate/phosphonate transport system substrate-binding protein